MKKTLLTTFLVVLFSAISWAQQRTVSGKISSSDDGQPIPGATIQIKGSTTATQTDINGNYTISAKEGQVLVVSFLGMKDKTLTLGALTTVNVTLNSDSQTLNEVVVTALNIKQDKRALGYSVTELKGNDLAKTQRENVFNSLQGRVAGLTVTNTSGLPGSSTSMMLRGVNSLSGSNEPLIVVDGIPYDNRSQSTATLASDKVAASALSDRSVDFTNRGADINPDDIESVTVLKGPEAAALYGINAASGAILITTKRGKSGALRVNYSNSFSVVQVTKKPEVQQVYGQGFASVEDKNSLLYFGPKYAEGTQFYDNIGSFFKTGYTQKHNISLEGGTENFQYRATGAFTGQTGIVPNSTFDKINLGVNSNAKISKTFSTDFSLAYSNSSNDQVFKGKGGPMLGLLVWPSTDDAKNYLNPDGSKRIVVNTTDDYENPYFNTNKNSLTSKSNRLNANFALNATPLEWLKFQTLVGVDNYTSISTILRHPQSVYGTAFNGMIDNSTLNSIGINTQSFVAVEKNFSKVKSNLKVGFATNLLRDNTVAIKGEGFLDPNFQSLNNTDLTKQRGLTTIYEKRLVGAFGSFGLSYEDLLFLNVTGRNDWSSTLPIENRSFFYPSSSLSFNFTELPFLRGNSVLSFGKLRASIAQVGKDAKAYSIYPALETKVTTGGGFGYGFTGPSPLLKPEKTTSYEFGTEMKFFKNRLGIEAAYYNAESQDQIISDLRLSYGTGFILQVYNGGNLRNEGVEIQLNATPVKSTNFNWDINANFTKNWNKLLELPMGLQEYYVSSTWVYDNVRNGAVPGQSINTFTGLDYARNINGDILINPSSGLPIQQTTWSKLGDRTPDFTIGLNNSLSYKNWGLSFLLDIRKGGDIYNATEHFLVKRGLSMRTLDREKPVIFKGVVKDGLENSGTPTKNNIQIIPANNYNNYYASMGPADFIEKDINWIRLKDITLNYSFSKDLLSKIKAVKSLSVFATATDVFLISNYTGLDPVVNGNSAAVGGSGAAGFDYGNFPMPRTFNFGIKLGL